MPLRSTAFFPVMRSVGAAPANRSFKLTVGCSRRTQACAGDQAPQLNSRPVRQAIEEPFNLEGRFHLLVDCPYCSSRVDGEVKGEHEVFVPEEGFPFKATLLECPVCHSPLVAGQDYVQTGPESYEWTEASRLWPKPEHGIDWSIPTIVSVSLEEARRCFSAKAFTACAVMCGRALEGVCRHFETKSKNLASGLKELREREIIDTRLFQWSDELRKFRNLGAHATEEEVSIVDAQDLLDFVNSICQYVFVMAKRFEDFQCRHARNLGS